MLEIATLLGKCQVILLGRQESLRRLPGQAAKSFPPAASIPELVQQTNCLQTTISCLDIQ